MHSIVALDLETTGLDPSTDAIIEIGAVRFNGSRVEEEWSTLINPNRPISSFITQLTGISNDMVRNAPPIQAVIQEFADFVGDAPILGQNIPFDLSFLNRYHILLDNESIDTYEMASVLLPSAGRYNLSALGQRLGIILPGNAHRALYDAQLTRAVFLALFEKAVELPTDLLAEFVRLSDPFPWGASWAFRFALETHLKEPIRSRQAKTVFNGPLFVDQDQSLPLLSPQDPIIPLNVDEIVSTLEYGGPFSRYFNSFEQRPEQIEMIRAIATAISESQHLMVEAGTGTGKSFAYLIPAAIWAMQNDLRVVISTNTINLQDQLINKDVPDLNDALGINLRATVLKGRSNYLCPHRLELLRRRGTESPEEMRVLAKILTWLYHGGSGDRNEINLNGPVENDIWRRISAENEGCKGEICYTKMGGICPFYQAKQSAQSAHIIIVNHALLLADVATGNRVLPEYDYLIVDEAHHLESATTNSLSYRATQNDLTRMLRELGGMSSGVLGHQLRLLHDILSPADYAAYHQVVSRATDLAFRLDHDFKNFFLVLSSFLEEQRDGRPVSAYGQQERILPATRTQPAWTDVEINWDSVGDTLKLLLNLLQEIYKSVANLEGIYSEELEEAQGNLSNLFRRFSEIETNLSSFVTDPDPDKIYWVEIRPNGYQLALYIAPLHIGPLMEKYLWHEKSSVILTSATLTANGEFDYLRNRLFAVDADELALGSPFDYETSTLLYIPNDTPEPSAGSSYQRAVEKTIVRLSKATGGKMLVLFTSYSQLKKTSQAISPHLADQGITVYEQGEGASPNTLLEIFRESERAVLLGTRAFWEGVDIPGEALSVLVIVKLPFDVPSDPIVAARSETFEDPFHEYNLPEAILRFRQGFGRLIRTQNDRGVVAVLDRRVLTKRYGRAFLESLPQCTVKIKSADDLPREAARWLNL